MEDETPVVSRRSSRQGYRLAAEDETPMVSRRSSRSSRRPKTEAFVLKFFPSEGDDTPTTEDDGDVDDDDLESVTRTITLPRVKGLVGIRRSKSLPAVRVTEMEEEEDDEVELDDIPLLRRKPGRTSTACRRDLWRSSTEADLGYRGEHPLMASPSNLDECLVFIDANKLLDLPSPMPRCQDLPSSVFSTPGPFDIVVAVSHPWLHQGHPDPLGNKMDIIKEHLRAIIAEHCPGCEVFVFLDFLSIPQHPFALDMAARTDVESERFERALHAMHEVYLHSDYIIHIDAPEEVIPGEGEIYAISGEALQSANISQVGPNVQISGKRPNAWVDCSEEREPQWGLFDCVLSMDGKNMDSAQDVREQVASCQSAELVRYPFGMRNNAPASSRAWVYLERFIAMVKCAMVEAKYTHRMALTNSQEIADQVYSGAQKLRDAAKADMNAEEDDEDFLDGQLDAVLDSFLDELRNKTFSGASIDACKKQHGLEDAEVIGGLMRELLGSLRTHWGLEASRQHIRAKRVWCPAVPN